MDNHPTHMPDFFHSNMRLFMTKQPKRSQLFILKLGILEKKNLKCAPEFEECC